MHSYRNETQPNANQAKKWLAKVNKRNMAKYARPGLNHKKNAIDVNTMEVNGYRERITNLLVGFLCALFLCWLLLFNISSCLIWFSFVLLRVWVCILRIRCGNWSFMRSQRIDYRIIEIEQNGKKSQFFSLLFEFAAVAVFVAQERIHCIRIY